MLGVGILWVHALAALILGGVTLRVAHASALGRERWPLALALFATALWALSVAGIGERELPTRLMMHLRSIAWLGVLMSMRLRATADPAVQSLRRGACITIAACMMLTAILSAAHSIASPAAALPIGTVTAALGMLSTSAAMLIAYRTRIEAGGQDRWFAGGLAMMWAIDIAMLAVVYFFDALPVSLAFLRGVAIAIAGILMAAMLSRDGDGDLRVSRVVALRLIVAIAIALFVLATALVTTMLGHVAGSHARVAQTAFVIGSAVAALTIASTPWLRAWMKVVVAKHLFDHRYDYRAEWLRFTETLGVPGVDSPPLSTRVVKAIADLTDSPAGQLLLVEDGAMVPAGAWVGGEAPAEAAPLALVTHLEATRRIIALDDARAGRAPAEEATALPDWLLARPDAWALVPLIHVDRLIGAIVLDRPPVDRRLDWEDFDLLGVAGRQVASYLAEARAHGALADARRFEEFNRRFAFIMHDLKNLVSQMALVARNAERHADNPAFRADMIATLQDSSHRMTALLARLSHQPAARGEAPARIAVRAMLDRLATGRRAQHPVLVEGDTGVAITVDPAALEALVGHLLQNAIEASPGGTPVTLATAQTGDEVTISVCDTGTGMSAAFVRDELFKPFVSSKPSGFGLGAYEARQLATAMGARLSVDSREGEGTCFRLTLPADVAGEHRATMEKAA